MRLSRRGLAASLLAFLPLACSDSNSVTGPSPAAGVNLSGTWSGTFHSSDPSVCSGALATATLHQTGSAVRGSFEAASCGIVGAVHGDVQGDTLIGRVEMSGCTGGAINARMSGSSLELSVGDFSKDLVAGAQEVLPGGIGSFRR